jgi:hypothetical protein
VGALCLISWQSNAGKGATAGKAAVAAYREVCGDSKAVLQWRYPLQRQFAVVVLQVHNKQRQGLGMQQ